MIIELPTTELEQRDHLEHCEVKDCSVCYYCSNGLIHIMLINSLVEEGE